MRQWAPIGVLLLGLAGLAIYCIQHGRYHIEQDILARTTQAVTAANIGIPDGGIVVDGRDVILKGPPGSTIVSYAAHDIIAKVRGVREPVKVVVVDPPAAPPLPLPAEATKLEGDLTQFLEEKNIRFDVNSDVIHPDGAKVLDEVFRILAPAPAVAVDITGHTDNDGHPMYNLDLSQRRAAAVKRYLVIKGINAERLATEGFGSAKPVVANDTPEHMARNRRIEFHANAGIPGAALRNK